MDIILLILLILIILDAIILALNVWEHKEDIKNKTITTERKSTIISSFLLLVSFIIIYFLLH